MGRKPQRSTSTKVGQSDREALKLALETARKDPLRRAQLEAKLHDEPFEEVARLAAYLCQLKALHLRPWQAPPAHTCDGPPSDKYGHRPEEIELLARMLAAGVSRFHPDPVAALAAPPPPPPPAAVADADAAKRAYAARMAGK